MNVLDKFILEGKKAIVTGAGRGLGEAMAVGLAQAGADVAVPDVRVESARDTAERIEEIGKSSMALDVDVTDRKEVEEMVERVMKEWGQVDVLVNNAGIVKNVPAEEMSEEEWEAVMDVNLKGVFLSSQAVGKRMIEGEGGAIINIASMSGMIVNYPQPQCSYNASKAGVSMLTKSLASEWAEDNVRVNAIAPGYMATEMTKQFVRKNEETVEENWLEPTPMGRMGEPEELVGAVVYLASPASSFMTGHVMVVDGGYTVR